MQIIDHRKWEFTILDNEIIFDIELSIGEKMTFITLCAFSNQDKSKPVFPSLNTLTELLNCSKPTVIKYLKNLEAKQYIFIEKVHLDSGDWNNNIYHISGGSKNSLLDVVKKFNYPSKNSLLKLEQENNNNTNNKISSKEDMSPTKQQTLIPIKAEETKKTTSVKKKLSHAELSDIHIQQARENLLSWDKVSDRDFTLYYEKRHGEILGKQVQFDRYSSIGNFRDWFINKYDIPREELADFIDRMLIIYRDRDIQSQKHHSLTFSMFTQTRQQDMISRLVHFTKVDMNRGKQIENKPSTITNEIF